MNKKKIIFSGLLVGILIIVGLIYFAGMKKEKEQNTESVMAEKELELVAEEENKTEDAELTERLEKIRQTGKATLVVENVLEQKQDLVKVRVWLVNNPGIVGMTAVLSYDQNILSLKSAKSTSKFQDVLPFNYSEDRSDGCIFLWTGKTLSKEQIFDGVLLTMEFKIKDGEKNIKTPIRLIPEVNGTYDNDLKEVELETDNGYVTIIRELAQ